jgi:hypothetical protein
VNNCGTANVTAVIDFVSIVNPPIMLIVAVKTGSS